MSTIKTIKVNTVNFDEIKRNFSCNTIKEWLRASKNMKMYKKFTDVCDEAKVKELNTILSDIHIPMAMRYLSEVRAEKTENPFDITSMIPEKVSHYAIGSHSKVDAVVEDKDTKFKITIDDYIIPKLVGIASAAPEGAIPENKDAPRPKVKAEDNKRGVVFVDPDTKKVVTAVSDGGVVGKPSLVSTISRLGVSCLRNKGVGDEINTKLVSAHPLNEFSPEVFAATVVDVQKVAMDYNQTKYDFAHHLSKHPERVNELRGALLAASPKVNRVNMVESVIVTNSEGKKTRSVVVNKATLLYPYVNAEYEPLYNYAQKYIQGAASGNAGRERRCGYLGIPGSQCYEHFVTLYDAGVKAGDSVLVTSKDVILISALRAVFGPKVYGIGTAKGMLSSSVVRQSAFDYVYVVDTITYTMSDSVVSATQQFFSSLETATILACTTSGRRILKFHPTALFSSVIAEYMGINLDKYRESLIDVDGKPKVKSDVYPPIVSPQMKMCPYTFKAQVFESYKGAYEDTPIKEGTRKDSIPKPALAEVLPYSFLARQELPLTISMCSMLGYAVYVEDGPKVNVMDNINQVTGCARLSYAYMWSGQGLSPHSYEIRKMAKLESGAMALATDEYSPFFGQTVLRELEEGMLQESLEYGEERPRADLHVADEEEEFEVNSDMFG